MDLQLDNKIVIITGGAGDIGSACAKQFLQEGAIVVVGDIDADRAAHLIQLLDKAFPSRIHFQLLDLRDESSVRAFVHTVVEQRGGIDVIVNCAADFYFNELTDWENLEPLERHFEIGLRGPVALIQEAWRCCRRSRSGSVINISSIAGHVGEPSAAAYTPIKAAQKGLTKSLAIDMAAFGGWSISVSPGHTRTRVHEDRAKAEGKSWEEYQQTSPQVKTTMFDRYIEPDEIAKWVAIAASPLGKLVTGQDLKVSLGIEPGGFNRSYHTTAREE